MLRHGELTDFGVGTALRLSCVVRVKVEKAGHLSGLLYVEALGQQVGHFDEAHQVVHITLDAAGHAWILDLHGKAPTVMQVAAMHLQAQ